MRIQSKTSIKQSLMAKAFIEANQETIIKIK